MLGVRAGVREAFATLVTLVGFLSRVQPAVLDQMVLMLEGLVADLALMRTFACVLIFVSEQRAALLKGFFTNVTSVKSLVCLLQSLPPWPSFSIQSFID